MRIVVTTAQDRSNTLLDLDLAMIVERELSNLKLKGDYRIEIIEDDVVCNLGHEHDVVRAGFNWYYSND